MRFVQAGRDRSARVLYVGWPPRHDVRFIVERGTGGTRFAVLWADAEQGLTLIVPKRK